LIWYTRTTGTVRVDLVLDQEGRRWRAWVTHREVTRIYACNVLAREPGGAREATCVAQIVVTLMRQEWPALARAATWSARNDLPIVRAVRARALG
jgi:hypothetical protein